MLFKPKTDERYQQLLEARGSLEQIVPPCLQKEEFCQYIAFRLLVSRTETINIWSFNSPQIMFFSKNFIS